MGTWVGVVVSTAAVVLAVLVFRSEDFMRRMGDARETQRQEAAQVAARGAEDALGQAIDCSITWALGNVHEDGVVETEHLAVRVQNNTDGNTATAVSVHYPPLFGDNWYDLSASLRAGELAERNMLGLRDRISLPEGNVSLVGKGEFRYTVGGIRWSRPNGEPATRI